MPSVHAIHGAELRWVAAGGAYELQAGDRVVARLGKGFGIVEAEAAEGRWELKHSGLIFQKVTILPLYEPRPMGAARDTRIRVPTTWVSASWRVVLTGGGRWVLRTPHGRVLEWRRAGLTTPDWVCDDEAGDPLIACRLTPEPQLAEVQLAPAARRVPELALVLLVGWFLVVVWEFYVRTGG
jgi:hypothetical protein